MKQVITILAFLTTSFLSAQSSVQGKVIDNEKKPIAFVNILVSQDSALVKANISKVDGTFMINEMPNGTYAIQISGLGFKPFNKTIELTKNYDLGTITLIESVESLAEVTITAVKPLIQVKPDRTIFNIDKNLSTAGDNGIELLRKAPGIQIDNNDNIIVEGKAGVLIYIDGRRSYLGGDDLTAFLKSLQADTIDSIEIITQPSSMYDAEGNAGIIDIKLKREKGLGIRGNASTTLTIGDFARSNSSISLSSKTKKLTLLGSYSNYVGRSTGFINLFRIQGDKIFDARSSSEYDFFSNNVRFGGDYFVNTKNTIGANFNASFNDSKFQTDSRTPIIDRMTMRVDSILNAPNSSNGKSLNLTTNVNYRFSDTLGTSFSADLDYGRYERVQFNNQPNVYLTPEAELLNENVTSQNTPIDIDIYSAKMDYERKLGKGIFGAGAKFSTVNTDNTFEFFDEVNEQSTLNTNRSNDFVFDENINAGYLNYKFAIGKFDFQAGLRVENTKSSGDLTAFNPNDSKLVERDYTDYFPSGGITFQSNQTNSTALIYSRRIQRPNYQDLNPFEYQIDELSFSRGNPFLQPQYTDNMKLSHTYNYTLTFSLSYSYITDYFARVTEAVGENRNFISTRNVADQELLYFSVSYPFDIKDWWSVYSSAYVYDSKYIATNPAFISIEQITYGGYVQNTFKLPKDLTFEISGWFLGPSIWGGTYEIEPLGSLNLAVQKKWNNWNAKLSLNDVLHTIPWSGTSQFGNLFIDGSGGGDSRNVSFSIGYVFGNKELKDKNVRESGAKDEQDRI